MSGTQSWQLLTVMINFFIDELHACPDRGNAVLYRSDDDRHAARDAMQMLNTLGRIRDTAFLLQSTSVVRLQLLDIYSKR